MPAPDPKGAVVVLTTVGDLEAGKRLARDLVREGRAACVSLVPGATSIYRWRDGIAEEGEVLLIIKTPRDRIESLREELAVSHPYEVPEFLALDVAEGGQDYMAWLWAATRTPLEEK